MTESESAERAPIARPRQVFFTYGPPRKKGPTAAPNKAPPVEIPISYAHEARLSETSAMIHVVLTTGLTEAKRSGARWLLTGCERKAPINLIAWTSFERLGLELPRCRRCLKRLALRRSAGAVIRAPAPPDVPTSPRRGRFTAGPRTLQGRMERMLAIVDTANRYGFEAKEPVDVFTLITEQARSVVAIHGKRYTITLEEESFAREPKGR